MKHKHIFIVPAMLKSLLLLLEFFSLDSLSLFKIVSSFEILEILFSASLLCDEEVVQLRKYLYATVHRTVRQSRIRTRCSEAPVGAPPQIEAVMEGSIYHRAGLLYIAHRYT
jgi:hypothetical protein